MRVIDALTSPIRQELVSQLGDRPATVRELALALGRTRQALHYHVAMLERAGIVRGAGWRGTGSSREQVYAIASGRVGVTAIESRDELAAVRKATTAMLRLTGRELQEALKSPRLPRPKERIPEIAALRGRARLTARDLGELHRLFGKIEAVMRKAKKGRGRKFYAVTFVLAPAPARRRQEEAV